jgi:hypothetical protein
MAILLNQISNLRMRLDLLERLSDGVHSPASLRMAVAVERYRHPPAGSRGEHRFSPLVSVPGATLLDLDLIRFLHALEDLLARPAPEGQGEAALEASVDPAIGLRIGGGPDAYQVEVGIDLLNVLEPLGGQSGERGSDLSLFRFDSNKRAVAAFCAALVAEFQGFPTDPSRVAPGNPG